MKEVTQDDFRLAGNITSINVPDADVDRAVSLLKENGIEVKGTEQAKSSLEEFYFGLVGGGEDV